MLLQRVTSFTHTWIIATLAFLAAGYSTFVVLMLVIPGGRRWVFNHRYQVAVAAVSSFCAYLTVELALSFVVTDRNLWLVERSDTPVRFDAVRGFKIGSAPARYSRITGGVIEYVSLIRGNNEGFPDRDDFHARRSSLKVRRFAVFGDSFSGGATVSRKWPDLVEDLTRESETPLELLNFSVNAGGLANWWSVLTKVVEAEHYELDGVVFAVWGTDLKRRFVFADYEKYGVPLYGRCASWDPRDYPSTLEEAEREHLELNGQIFSPQEFDRAVRGRPWRRFPFLARRGYQLVHLAARLTLLPHRARRAAESATEGSALPALIADIRRCVNALGVPVIVVSVPARENLPRPAGDSHVDDDKLEFAKLLGAEFVDGSVAFQGLTKKEVRALWLPYDGHWAQAGSDRFGRFMARVLTLERPRSPRVAGQQ
jgi:hypothetical protein